MNHFSVGKDDTEVRFWVAQRFTAAFTRPLNSAALAPEVRHPAPSRTQQKNKDIVHE